MKECFIVSPIGNDDSEIRKRANQLLNHIIKPVCAQLEFEVIRVDQINASDSINQTIIEKLSESELVIADITDHNPNVFYEIGYRYRTNKPMIHLRAPLKTP